MPLPPYEYRGAFDHTIEPDIERAAGKSVIVTGGANGIGESCVRHLVDAGAFETFADLNERGATIEKELNSDVRRCQFVKCDIRSWEDQNAVFEAARSQSPSHSVDVVIANAGISRSSGDSLWQLDGELRRFVPRECSP
jgi:NAD(P)-dependent dehydrogenase (short-subunit alcohol dehydrogenase family)